MNIWQDIDTAITIPVNLMPLIDDTDFKTREVAIAYNESGMDLVWNFQTTAGVTSQTAVTPTTAGDYDWTHSGDGMYKVEMPASGGASINNDTEGFGWLSGICDGVLAWRGPLMGFRAAALNNALIDGGDVLDVNMTEISGDTSAADNLELQYDTTGLTGDTFPATQLQLGNIALTGSAVSTPAKDAPNGFVITFGENETNDEDSTHALDGVTHDLEAINDGGTEKIECYYEFAIGGAGVPANITAQHQFNKGGGSNKNLTIWAYNWNTTAWDQIGTLSSSTSLETDSYTLFTSHVGTGGNLGLVRIRYLTGSVSLTATSKLLVDQIFVEYAVINRTVGYADGAIWVDTNASNTNTESFVDGTADNPVSTWAAALTLSGQLNITRFHIVNGSAITLTGNSDNYNIMGQGYTLALNNQPIASAYIFGATTSGIGTGGGTVFEDCPIGDVTLEPSVMRRCFYFGTITNSGTGDWFINDPRSRVAGSGSPMFDFGTAIGNTNLNIRGNSGGWQLESMGDTGTDTASIEGWGQIIEGTCTGGAVTVRGNFTTSGITNLTLSDNARFEREQLVDDIWDEILDSETHNITKSAGKRMRQIEEYQGYEGGSIYINTTGGGSAGSDNYVNGVLDNPVDNLADALTISASLGITCFNVSSGSSLTFISAQDGRCFMGNNWTVALGGQDINGAFIQGATMTGIAAALTTPPKVVDCEIGIATLPPGHYHSSGFTDKVTAAAAGDYFFTDCESSTHVGFPVFDFGAAIGSVNAHFREYRGELELENMNQTGTDTASIDGNGRVKTNVNCIGGTISVQGHQEFVNRATFIAAGGTVEDASRFALDQLVTHVIGQEGDTLESIKDRGNVAWVTGSGSIASVIIAEKIETLLDINKPLNLIVSTTTRLQYQWLDIDGDPVDITSATFAFKAVKNAGESSPAIAEIAGTIADAPNGRFYFDVLPTTVFKGRYEIWSTDGVITPLTMAGGARIETHPRL